MEALYYCLFVGLISFAVLYVILFLKGGFEDETE